MAAAAAAGQAPAEWADAAASQAVPDDGGVSMPAGGPASSKRCVSFPWSKSAVYDLTLRLVAQANRLKKLRTLLKYGCAMHARSVASMLTPRRGSPHCCDEGARRGKSDGPAAGGASAETDDDYKHIIASIRSTIISVCPEDLKPYLIPPEPNRVANKDRLAVQATAAKAAAAKAAAPKKRQGEAAGKAAGATSPTAARKRSPETSGDPSKRPKVAASEAAPAPAAAPSPPPAAAPAPAPASVPAVVLPPVAPEPDA